MSQLTRQDLYNPCPVPASNPNNSIVQCYDNNLLNILNGLVSGSTGGDNLTYYYSAPKTTYYLIGQSLPRTVGLTSLTRIYSDGSNIPSVNGYYYDVEPTITDIIFSPGLNDVDLITEINPSNNLYLKLDGSISQAYSLKLVFESGFNSPAGDYWVKFKLNGDDVIAYISIGEL